MDIETYEGLKRYTDAYWNGDIPFLIIRGRGGTGKTYTATYQHKDKQHTSITGHTTPLSLYHTVRKEPRRVVFDDTDALLDSKTNTALLKQICDTTPKRTVTWNTTRQGEHIEQTYRTDVDVLLITNQPENTTNNDLKALYNRAVTITFNPTNEEVLQIAKKFTPETITTYVESKKLVPHSLTLRLFKKATQHLNSPELNHKEYLDHATTTPRLLYQKLHAEHNKKNAKKKYMKQMQISKSTYYRHRQKYQSKQA